MILGSAPHSPVATVNHLRRTRVVAERAALRQGFREGQFARNTSAGSSLDARYAGIRLAKSATNTSSVETAASVSGSDALTPNTSLVIRRPAASDAAAPTR